MCGNFGICVSVEHLAVMAMLNFYFTFCVDGWHLWIKIQYVKETNLHVIELSPLTAPCAYCIVSLGLHVPLKLLLSKFSFFLTSVYYSITFVYLCRVFIRKFYYHFSPQNILPGFLIKNIKLHFYI